VKLNPSGALCNIASGAKHWGVAELTLCEARTWRRSCDEVSA